MLEKSIITWHKRQEVGAFGKIAGFSRSHSSAQTAFLEPAALEPAAPAAPAVVAAWSVRYTTEDDEVVKKSLAQVGVAYYYNLETSVAQWTCPEGFTPAETAASAASARS